MNVWMKSLSLFALIVSTVRSDAFALLGPVQPWMQVSNGVIQIGDIGGPMDIGSGYRWNVPVVTYGFDQSFLSFFGTNGVSDIEAAIKMINDLPPASQFVQIKYQYPMLGAHVNYSALAQNYWDLKSTAITLLLEQLGLAKPTKNVFVIKRWTDYYTPSVLYSYLGIPNPGNINYEEQELWPDWYIPDYITHRNFDPETHQTTQYINSSLYFATIYAYPHFNWIHIYPIDGWEESTTVADGDLSFGYYYDHLSRDDVGGLSYLYSTNTVQFENLLPSVCGVNLNSNNYVIGAWRPGIDKITFIPHPVNSIGGEFLPVTNNYTDTYIANGNVFHQELQRAINQPDFLFTAADIVGDIGTSSPLYDRTGTTNWINNALLNGNTSGEGPGVIQPPVKIAFNKIGLLAYSYGNHNTDESIGSAIKFQWASFGFSTNAPVCYSTTQAGSSQTAFRMWLEKGAFGNPNWSAVPFEWGINGSNGAQYIFQTTTNFQNWVTLFAVTNDGTACNFFNNNPNSSQRFYRLIPQ